MDFNLKEMFTATMVLFAIIDILGTLPMIITVRKKVGVIASGKVSLLGFILMVIFLFSGKQVLSVIGISVSSFAVAGSIVLFIIALEMILGIQIHKHDEKGQKQSIFVPLTFPIMIGPGTLTSLLSLRAEFAAINIVCAITINVIIVYMVLRFSNKIEPYITPSATQIIQRVFGIILMALAVKLFANNVSHLF